VIVGGALEHREPRFQGRHRQREHALDGGRVDRDAGGAEATVKQELCERPSKGVSHDDWRGVELADDHVVVVDDLLNAQVLDARRVAA
jgi:hypothetical protein